MSLQTRLTDLATAIGTDIKTQRAATGITVSPSGLAVVTGTDVQTAISQLDSAEKANNRRTAKALLRTGAIAETCDRRYVTDGAGNFTVATGQTRWAAIQLEAGDVIHSVTIPTGTTAAGTPTHHYGMLASSAGVVLAVSADRTTTAIPAATEMLYTFAASYTVTTSGLFYVGWNVTATTTPTCCDVLGQYTMNLAPSLAGITSGNSTPPVTGTTIVINSNARIMYAWVA